MVKADIKTENGTHITIEGNEQEVQRLLSIFSMGKGLTNVSNLKKRITSKGSGVFNDLIEELKTDGFFDKPKNIMEIKKALEAKGRIYDTNSLSTPLLRQIRKRSLGRVKIEDNWGYVRR